MSFSGPGPGPVQTHDHAQSSAGHPRNSWTLPEPSESFPRTPHRRLVGSTLFRQAQSPVSTACCQKYSITSQGSTVIQHSRPSVSHPVRSPAMSTQYISSAQFAYPATAAAAATSYFPVPFHLQTAQYPTWPTSPTPVYNAVYPMPQIQQVITAPSCNLFSA